jgi:hypothetical protein
MAKYSIVKGKSGKAKKVVVAGVKKVLYKKEGSMSMYVISKKRHIKLTKYKKMKMKGGEGQTGGKRKKKGTKRGGNLFDIFRKNILNKKDSELSVVEQQTQNGGRKKKKKSKKSKK